MDQRRRPDDQADLRVRDPGPRQRDRERSRERMEPGLDGEDGEGEPQHPRIIEEEPVRSAGRWGAGPGGPGPGGSAGRRGRLCLAGIARPSSRCCTATYPAMHSCLSGPARRRAQRLSRRRSSGGSPAAPSRCRAPSERRITAGAHRSPLGVVVSASMARTRRSRRMNGLSGGFVIARTVGSGVGAISAYRSQKSTTSSGSNCVPACCLSSAMAASCDIARLYGRSWVIAS